MTAEQFNQKYKEFLADGHYGCALASPAVEYLDEKFQEFIKKPGFKYSQIKLKFGMGRFYADGLSVEEITEVENKITQLSK